MEKMEFEEQEKIFTEIYNDCDSKNVNNVQVSALLTYIGPYIDSSSHHFEELKKILDPNDLNPFIDRETFLSAMLCWSDKFKHEVDFNFNSEEISRQSSPTTITLKVDYDALNTSSVSGYSLTGSILSTIDPNILQEQNNELQHQNKKLTDCLDDVKGQLIILEELNVSLQNQIDRAEKNSILDQKLIKTLQAKCVEYEREREEHTNILDENLVNYENLVLYKRVKCELENRIRELETQNKTHSETIEKQTDIINEKQEQNQQLLQEIATKHDEIHEKEMKCKQLQLNIDHFILETDELKSNIRSLEGLIENNAEEEILLKSDQFQPELNENEEVNDGTKTVLINKRKARSLSPEEDFCVPMERRTSPQESLLAEMANISSMDCFHSCEYRINQLEEELNKVQEELSSKEDRLKMREDELKMCEDELRLKKDELKLREGQLRDTQNANMQLTITNRELDELKKNVDVLARDKQQMQSERNQMYNKITYYKVLNRNFKIALDTKTNEIISIRKRVQAKEQEQLIQIEELKSTLNKVNVDMILKEGEYKIRNEEMIKVQHQLHIFENEVKELKELNCKLMNEISSLERAVKLERKRNTRVDLNCKINKLEEQLELAKSKNCQLTSTVSNLTLEKKQFIHKLEQLENSKYSRKKVESLEVKLHKCRKTITDLENQVSLKTNENKQLNGEHAKMSENYNALLALIDQWKITINTNIDSLKSTVFYAADIWRDILSIAFPELHLESLINTTTTYNYVENNEFSNHIDLLNSQINVATILLKAFAIMKSKFLMKKTDEAESCGNKNKTSNSHGSKKESSSSSLFSRFALKATPTRLLAKPKTKPHFVFPPMLSESQIPEKDTNQNEFNNNNLSDRRMDEVMHSASELNDDSASRTCNDSLIEKILAEQRVVEPLEQMHSNDAKEKEIVANNAEEQMIKERLARQVRSLSEGAPIINESSKDADGEILVFPHLQDATLYQLSLIPKPIIYNNQQQDEVNEHEHEREHEDVDEDDREHEDEEMPTKQRSLTDEEIEEKFQTLAFAFSVDALTLRGRLEMQQRQRDQAERNLNAEIVRLKKVVGQLPQLQEPREQRELINAVWERVQLVVQATQRVSTCAQILGSFQQEWRISEAVALMLTHLKAVIKQRDATRKQLEITKKMLQETTTSTIAKKTNVMATRRLTVNTLPTRNVVMPPRRASIAVISEQQRQQRQQLQPQPLKGKIVSLNVAEDPLTYSSKYFEGKKIIDRRQTLLSIRPPSRLDLNVELKKIQEGCTENFSQHNSPVNNEDEWSSDDDEYDTPTSVLPESPLSAIEGPEKVLRYYGEVARGLLQQWGADGSLHEICFVGTVVCFAMATILLCNTVMEIEVARGGVRQIPWKWLTWEEIFAFLT